MFANFAWRWAGRWEVWAASGFRAWWRHVMGRFSLGTLVINVTGSFIIGVFAALNESEGRQFASPVFRQFFMIGICGGYTTFSSFSLETLKRAQDGKAIPAATWCYPWCSACSRSGWAMWWAACLTR